MHSTGWFGTQVGGFYDGGKIVAFHGKLRELHSYIYEFESTAECTDVLMRISFLTELHTRRRS